jgi:uncharacterized membrane protein YbhN (UPF0104 family)
MMRWRLVAVLLVTIGCLAWVLSLIDPTEASTALQTAQWWTFVPMFLMYMLAHTLRSWRLGLLLGQPVPFKGLFAVNAIGFLAINVVPLRLGEAVRPYLLQENHGIAYGHSVAAIVIERIIDLGMLLTMLLGLTWWVQLPAGGVQVQGIDVLAAGQQLAGVGVGLGIAGLAAVVVVGEPVIGLIRRLPAGARLGGFAEQLRLGVADLARSPARFVGALGLTVGVWGATLVGVGCVMAGFPGVPASLGSVWTVWSVTLAGMTALPTPGFFGGYELFCVAALALWGVPAGLAATFALTLHIGQFIFTCGIGGSFVMLQGLSLRQVVAQSRR